MTYRLGVFLGIAVMLCFPVVLPSQIRDSPNAAYNRGVELAKNGDFRESIVYFEEAVSLSPYWSLAYYALGKAYLCADVEDNISKGTAALKNAADLDKRSADAWFYLGMAYYLKKDYPHAVTSFNQAFLLDDTYIAALYNIASIYDLMGHTSKAVLFYKKYLDAKKREEEYFNF